MSRFSDGLDGIFTASTTKEANSLPPAAQPYPGAMPAPATPIPHETIARSELAPVAPASGPVAAAPSTRPPVVAARAAPAVPAAPLRREAAAGKDEMTWVAGKVPLPSSPPAGRLASAALDAPTPKAPAQKAAPTAPKVERSEAAAKPSSVVKAVPPAVKSAAMVAKPNPIVAGSYTVASGDSLMKIAKKTGVSVAQLKAANNLGAGGLKIGQKLALTKSAAIASPAKTAIAKTETAPAAKAPAKNQVAAAKPAPALDPMPTASAVPGKAQVQPAAYTPPQSTQKALQDVESASTDAAPEETGVGKMRWPVRGRVVARYGGKGSQSSDGIDIAVPEGTPVKAAENGVVIYAGDGLKEFGNTVLVRHDDGLVTVYGNASQLKVTRGEKVSRGQDIALSGMSGSADTPKLHFEVRKNSAPVDPSGYLQ